MLTMLLEPMGVPIAVISDGQLEAFFGYGRLFGADGDGAAAYGGVSIDFTALVGFGGTAEGAEPAMILELLDQSFDAPLRHPCPASEPGPVSRMPADVGLPRAGPVARKLAAPAVSPTAFPSEDISAAAGGMTRRPYLLPAHSSEHKGDRCTFL